jgi:hypothetical protein
VTKPTYKIDQLIIKSPYDEPARHWSYDRESRLFTCEQGRRPAGYCEFAVTRTAQASLPVA